MKRYLTDEPIGLLADALVLGSSGAIERQEKRGQERLVQSQLLPIQMNGKRAVFEAMGIIFHDDRADDLFVPVTLPAGWLVKDTDHSMWSKLVDEKGRERASIFYKAAFYDRDAFMRPVARFGATYQPVGGWDTYEREVTPYEGVVTDGGEVVWSSEPIPTAWDRDSGEPFPSDKARDLAAAWLDEKYPDWQNPLAHW